MKDSVGLCVFFLVWAVLVFFAPNFLGDANNFIPANPLQTPADIVPEWYLLPYYAILRSVPNKLLGVCMMFGSILILFVLPWLDTRGYAARGSGRSTGRSSGYGSWR